MGHRCKRIIDGRTYNTETATEIADWADDVGIYELYLCLYKTRFGAFFEYGRKSGGEDDGETIRPLTPEDARTWLEQFASSRPELIEFLFGEMPEAGSGEVKFTLRIPESLRRRLATRAKENRQSLNAWMVRCLERCATPKGEKV